LLEAHAAAILYGTDVYIAQCVLKPSSVSSVNDSVSDLLIKCCRKERWEIKLSKWDDIPFDATIVMHTAGKHYVRVVPVVSIAKPTTSSGIIFQRAMQHLNEQNPSASSSGSSSSGSSSSSGNGGSSGSSGSSRKRLGGAAPMTRNTRSRASMTNKKNDESVLRQKILKNSNEFIHTQIKDTSPPPALGSFMLRMFALFSSNSCVRIGTATRCTRTYSKHARHPKNDVRNKKVVISIHSEISLVTL
jgi:hypothetical protein